MGLIVPAHDEAWSWLSRMWPGHGHTLEIYFRATRTRNLSHPIYEQTIISYIWSDREAHRITTSSINSCQNTSEVISYLNESQQFHYTSSKRPRKKAFQGFRLLHLAKNRHLRIIWRLSICVSAPPVCCRHESFRCGRRRIT